MQLREAWIPQPGEVIAGHYQVQSTLGQGSCGVVLAARHTRTGGAVAIKWLLPSVANEMVQRFITEARAIARVEHPNVVHLHDFGEDRGTPYIVMERLRGESLRARLDRERRLPPAEAIALLVPAMRGVTEAHREGIVHRDLKPDNIFLCVGKDGRDRPPKVVDFGIAKLFDSQGDPLTGTGVLVGTPHYMSPEQLKAPREIDVRFDVYALGVVLYEVLTGRCPFEAEGIYPLIAEIMTAEPPRPSSLVPGLPPALEAVVLRAIHRDPDVRFGSVDALIDSLEPLAPAASDRPSEAPVRSAPVVRAPLARSVAMGETSAFGGAARRRVIPPTTVGEGPRGEAPDPAPRESEAAFAPTPPAGVSRPSVARCRTQPIVVLG